MKNTLLTFLFLTSFFNFSQKVIYESTIEKGTQLPHEIEFSIWKNTLLIKKGVFKGAVKSHNSLDEVSLDDFSIKTIFKDQKLFSINQSVAEEVFYGSEHSGVGWRKDDKFIDNKGNLFASKKLTYDYQYVTKDKLCFVSDEKGENLSAIKDKDDIYFTTLNLKDFSTSTIMLEKPNFLNDFKKELFIKPFYYKDYFEIGIYKVEDVGNSFVLKSSKYDYNGKIISTNENKIIVGVPLIYTDVGGGITIEGIKLMYNEKVGMSIFGEYTDLKGNFYYYGAFGEDNGNKKTVNNETKGFFIIKYSNLGKQIWLKKFEINDKDVNENASKNNLNTCLDMVNNKLRFTLTKHKFDQYFYYAHINPETGEMENSNKITFKVDSVSLATLLTTPLLSFFKVENLKYLRMDFNTMYYYQTNPQIKKYLESFTEKKEIHLQTQFNKDGIVLSESDNKKYYKITYFKF